jgi:DNA-binding transcriptional MerR regulator
MDEKSTILIPSASEKQGYKYLLDRAWARRRKEKNQSSELQNDTTQAPDLPASAEVFEQEALSQSEIQSELELAPEEECSISLSPSAGLELDPDKNYYRIGEVAHLLSVEPHVLRYWENEFSHIRPTKSGGQRVYNRKTVESLQQIQHLLYKEGFSISGARKRIKEERHHKHAAPPREEAVVPQKNLADLEKGLRDLIRFAETTPAF